MTEVSGMVCGGVLGNDGDDGPNTLTSILFTTKSIFQIAIIFNILKSALQPLRDLLKLVS